jgi:hypothetical protein
MGSATGNSLHRALSEKTGGRRDAFSLNAITGMASTRAPDSECHRRPDGVVVRHSPRRLPRAKTRVRDDRFSCPAWQECDTAGVPRDCAPPGKLATGTGSDEYSGHRNWSGHGSPVTARASSRPFHARGSREACRTSAAARVRAMGRSCPRSTESTGTGTRPTRRSRWFPRTADDAAVVFASGVTSSIATRSLTPSKSL